MFRFLEMRNSTAQLGALATGLSISMRSYRSYLKAATAKGMRVRYGGAVQSHSPDGCW